MLKLLRYVETTFKCSIHITQLLVVKPPKFKFTKKWNNLSLVRKCRFVFLYTVSQYYRIFSYTTFFMFSCVSLAKSSAEVLQI